MTRHFLRFLTILAAVALGLMYLAGLAGVLFRGTGPGVEHLDRGPAAGRIVFIRLGFEEYDLGVERFRAATTMDDRELPDAFRGQSRWRPLDVQAPERLHYPFRPTVYGIRHYGFVLRARANEEGNEHFFVEFRNLRILIPHNFLLTVPTLALFLYSVVRRWRQRRERRRPAFPVQLRSQSPPTPKQTDGEVGH